MRELMFIERGTVRWRESPPPELAGDREALVRPVCVSTCDLDRAILAGAVPIAAPFALGHECVAEVIDIGDDVTAVRPGDLVSVPYQVSCGACDSCRRGYTGNCSAVGRLAMYGLPMGDHQGGFFSDVVRVPFADAMLVPVPPDIDPATIASLSDNLVDGWRTVGPALEERPGAKVLVVAGTWSIGAYAAAIAVASGAQRVDVVGGDAFTRAAAERMGATLLEPDYPKRVGDGYPITVDASGIVAGLHCALRSTEPEGLCTSIGIYFEQTTPVPLLEMYTKGIRFSTGRVHARPAMEPVLHLVRSGKLRPQLVTGEQAGWADAAEAVAAHRSKLVVSREQIFGALR